MIVAVSNNYLKMLALSNLLPTFTRESKSENGNVSFLEWEDIFTVREQEYRIWFSSALK